MKQFVITLLILYSCLNIRAQTGVLTVIVTGIESNEGNIKAAIYVQENKDGFLKDINMAYQKKKVSLRGKETSFTFSNLPFGTYAVSLFQDINDNGELELAPIGFPLEPYGVSGNQNFIGPPSFEKSKFDFKSKNQTIYIQIKQFKKK